MDSPTSSMSRSDSGSELSTRPTTAPSSPIFAAKSDVGLPSPFYPPSLAQLEGYPVAAAVPSLPEYYPSVPLSIRADDLRETDAQTKGTPDEWCIRDSKLVRLTGKWPFNSEAPLPDLWQYGFLTPTKLFYVRNHGVVPRVTLEEAANWTIEISGLVDNPCTLSLADLIDPSNFQTVTLPVTLVCAGNRRKEQNVVKKSLGFNWGAGGLSTALFTGVYLADVLAYARPRNDGVIGREGFKRAEHVVFEGAEDLPNGKYGTSQRLRWARMKEKGMLLSWAMNGEALEPDHGFPLRLVVPGQIGGRSVKWLKKIVVSDKESQHHLHFWDNKVLPTTLTAEQARAERDWWYDPRYIINDLNVNSAIARPAHDEKLIVPEAAAEETYRVEGYVYAGGGRRVTRVELSLDEGESWTLADLRYPEDQYRTLPFEDRVWGSIDLTDRDECFCWAFWSIDVPISKLVDTGSIAVRGMDESLALQPSAMYWNPTGMMNNYWFRIAVHKSLDTNQQTVLTFEHPTMPGLQPGGWMERMKEAGIDPLKPVFKKSSTAAPDVDKALEQTIAKKPQLVMTKAGVNRKITMEEVRTQGATEEAPWFIVHGEVYDGSGFLKDHPGGSESITLVAGEDASEDFMAIHSIDAKLRLVDFHIGTLVKEEGPSETAKVVARSEPDPVFLSKTKWKPAELVSIDRVNHDSRLYRFALEHPDQPLGLPIGQHVYSRLRRKTSPSTADGTPEAQGELVQRAYTPVSLSNAKGFIDLLIKVYFPTPGFPAGGKMTLGFEELVVGDKIEFRGPLGSFEWLGEGKAKWRGIERRPKQIGLICGGSGITPILQVLRGVIHDPTDSATNLFLLNANKTESDILLRTELNTLAELAGEDRYRQHLVLSQASPDWVFSKGRINRQMLLDHLPQPGNKEDLILICGPDPMIQTVKEELAELGWDVPNQLVVF